MNKQDFLNAMNKVNISKEAEQRIMKKAMSNSYKKERVTMSKKKISFIAVAATLVMSVVVYATSGVISSWVGSSSSIPDYKQLPSAEQCVEDIGYAPVLIDEFENGYNFKNGSIVKNDLKDDGGNSVEKFKSVTMRYDKNNDEVILSAQKYLSEMETTGEVVATVNGADLIYNHYTNKSVPADYKLTAGDKKAEENGELIFSYGASEVSISEVQGLSWEYDGVHYNLTQIDGKLTSAELVEMAKEIINK